MAARQLGQAHAVGFHQPDAGFAHFFEKLAHPRILSRYIDVYLKDGLGCGLQAHADRMKTEQDFGSRHATIINADGCHPAPCIK